METDEDDERSDEWCEDSEISPLAKAKLLSIKICRNRCVVHGKSEYAKDVAKPVLDLLFSILRNTGAVTPEVIEEYVPGLH